jgi:hypothetical protein
VTAQVSSGAFLRIRENVAHNVRWFVDNQAIVLYADSAGPIVRMLTSAGAQLQVHRLADDYLSGKHLRYSRPTEIRDSACSVAPLRS